MPSKSHENGEMKIEIADWSSPPDDLALRVEMKTALEQAIGNLPENYRSVILLRDMEELSRRKRLKFWKSAKTPSRLACIGPDWLCARSWTSLLEPPMAPLEKAWEVNDMGSGEHSDKCKQIFALLSDYLNLELPPDACQEIENHLAGCAPCIEFAESLRKTVELCRGYRPAELPEPLEKEAREQLLAAYRKMVSTRLNSRAAGLAYGLNLAAR